MYLGEEAITLFLPPQRRCGFGSLWGQRRACHWYVPNSHLHFYSGSNECYLQRDQAMQGYVGSGWWNPSGRKSEASFWKKPSSLNKGSEIHLAPNCFTSCLELCSNGDAITDNGNTAAIVRRRDDITNMLSDEDVSVFLSIWLQYPRWHHWDVHTSCRITHLQTSYLD